MGKGSALQHSFGTRLQYGIFRFLVAWHCVWLARGMIFLIIAYYTLLPGARKRCQPYLHHRFPGANGWQRLRHTWRLHSRFAQILFDRLCAQVTGSVHIAQVKPEHALILASLAKSTRGCIVVSGHVGAWHVGLAGLEAINKPISLLQFKTPGDNGGHFFEGGRGKQYSVIDANDPVGALVSARSVLLRGEILCCMGDRVTPNTPPSHTVLLPFLGAPIRVPIMPYILASMTNAQVLLLLTSWEDAAIHIFSAELFSCDPNLSRKEPLLFEPYARRFVAAMERFVAYHPYQFFNFYNMWNDSSYSKLSSLH